MNAVGEPILDRDGANRVPSIASPALTIVIPTLNERENIEPLVELLTAALRGIAWGALFVDGASPDGTAEHVQTLAHSNPRIRSMQRTRPDLAAAVIEGVLASASPFVAVMDADLQHDERLLPEMMKVLEHGDDVDLVVGSRYIVGGGVGDWNRRRARLSRLGTSLVRRIYRADLADPLSGFFMCRREVFERALPQMSGRGFKVLLDLLASSPESLQVRELPYTFRQRQHGESKLGTMAILDFAKQLHRLVGA